MPTVGAWRSLVAHLPWAQVVAGSNPAAPTIFIENRPCLGTSGPCFNFEPPATDEEIGAASLQFVRKLSGFNGPSRANAAAFDRAVEEVTQVARRLVMSW